mgnify:CR=1 FL=1
MTSQTMSDLVAPEYLSPSSMTTFLQCPLKFKYSRIDKLVEPPTVATIRGNFVHDVLEALYRLEPDQRTLEAAKDLARTLWDSTWREVAATLIFNDKYMHEFRWSAWWCIENLWQIEDPQSVIPSGLETEVVADINGVRVRGFIDRYTVDNSNATISDYKTGKKPHPKYQDDKFFQLLVYALVLNELKMCVPTKLELLFLKDSVRLEMTVTESDLLTTQNTIAFVKNAIDASCQDGLFKPVKHKLCDWCHFKPICPAWKGTK